MRRRLALFVMVGAGSIVLLDYFDRIRSDPFQGGVAPEQSVASRPVVAEPMSDPPVDPSPAPTREPTLEPTFPPTITHVAKPVAASGPRRPAVLRKR